MNNLPKTPQQTSMIIAQNFRDIRKRKKVSVKALAQRSGVGNSSIRRFESTGQISLKSLIAIASVLGIQGQLEDLFSDIPPTSIEEVLNEYN